MPKARLAYLLHDASRAVRSRFETHTAEIGLTSSQWRLMSILMREGPLPQARIAELMEIEPISVSRLVDRMEQGNWVERAPSPNDRRVRLVAPTEKAQSTFTDARNAADKVYAESMTGMPEGTYEQLTDILETLINNLNTLNNQHR